MGRALPKGEVEIGTEIGRCDGASICCHIRKEVGRVARGILRSSARATFGMEAMVPDLAGSYMDAPSWVICLEWRSLHPKGACVAKGMQRCWAICFACAPAVVSMPSAPSKVGKVSLYAQARKCCGDTPGD